MRCRLTILLVLGLAAGCGPELPPLADGQQAQHSLQTALDAWKGGAHAESLQRRTPPIHFNDEFWRDGLELQQFQIREGARNGMGWRCEVALTVKDATGQTTERKVGYQIDTDPAIVIVQQP